ncbi:MAG: hypothetical protein JXA33_12720 [Anaerolineae bacterium]|nr:hypothetical protein [Anaerolineae bacterium]
MQTESQHFAFELTVQNNDFLTEWQRCNMVANYVADYTAYQFAQRERAENLISTITNELLETVVRVAPGEGDLLLRCVQMETGLLLETYHQVRAAMIAPFRDFIATLNHADLDDLYLTWLTTETQPAMAFNQLGLIMLVHDFGARVEIYWDDPQGHIHIQVFIPNDEFSKEECFPEGRL